MSSACPSLARSAWPAAVGEEDRPRRGPNLPKLEQLLDQAVAATGPADRWGLALTLGRCLARLLARIDQAPGDERMSLESGLILSNYNVATWARAIREKLRGNASTR
jgi:hypothetical protein